MNFQPRNILVIDFGQLGDVVLSLPALRAIRERFPNAKITIAVGKSCQTVAELSGYANDVFAVDRVELRDSARLWSIWQIVGIVQRVRAENFDFVIDLHSLAETNILGFLSGASHRLYNRREGRSLDFLANFNPLPPREDRAKHATDRYLDVLKPLGITNADRTARLTPRAEDAQTIDKMWRKSKFDEILTVGLFPGAGHPSRRWSLEKFGELAELLERNNGVRPIVFLGPEELELSKSIGKSFPAGTPIIAYLTLSQFVAALANLSVFVVNDTGPMHLAAAVGTPVVLLMDERAPTTYLPLIKELRVLRNGTISEIAVEAVYDATSELLAASRVERLFTR